MKKIICLLLISVSLFSVSASGFVARSSSMGNIGLNVSSQQVNAFYNPASVYFYEKQNKFNLNFSIDDSFRGAPGLSFEKPDMSFSGVFASNYMSLLFDLEYRAERTDTALYDMDKEVVLGLNATAGAGDFAAGIGFYFHSLREKNNVSIDESRTFIDLLEKGIFNEFAKEGMVSSVNVKAGMGYMADIWSASILMDDFIDSRKGSGVFNFERILNSFGLGVGFNSSPYTSRGRLNNLVFGSEFEFWNIFSTNSSMHAGLELTVQLVRNKTISLRGGVELPFFNAGNGVSTFGIGCRLGDVDFNALVDIPFVMYADSAKTDVTLKMDITVLI